MDNEKDKLKMPGGAVPPDFDGYDSYSDDSDSDSDEYNEGASIILGKGCKIDGKVVSSPIIISAQSDHKDVQRFENEMGAKVTRGNGEVKIKFSQSDDAAGKDDAGKKDKP